MPIFLDDNVLTKSNLGDYLHQFTIKNFVLGGFAEEELYPLKGFEKVIDK